MALKFYWRCESGTFAAQDYSSGDDTPGNSNQTYGTAGAKVGTNGLIAAASLAGSATFDPATILANSASIDTSVGSAGYWWKAETTFPANGLTHGLRIYGNVVASGLRVRSVTGSKLQLLANNPVPESATASPAAALSAGTWYFIVVRWDIPGDKMALEIYEDAGGGTVSLTTSAETTSGISTVINSTDIGVSTWTGLQWNVHDASNAQRTFTDNCFISDVYNAPLQSNAFITDYTTYTESTATVAPKASFYRMLRSA